MLNKALLSLFLFIAFAFTTALAYQITEPTDGQTWTVAGPNTVTWERVVTDPSTFAIVLVNEDRSVFPISYQLLASNVDGALLSIAITPSTTFPTGSGFRVNFIKNANEPNTIYAQSSQFTIGGGGSSSTGSSGTSSVSASKTSTDSSTSAISAPHVTYTAPEDTQTVTVTVNAAFMVKDDPNVLYILVVSLFLVAVA